MAKTVAGIDRWREGWIIAEPQEQSMRLWVAPDITDVIGLTDTFDAVAIDMPIALAVSGRREAEAELRAVLGRSARSVFTSPTRAAVEATSQNEATEINRERGGPGISAQAFGLFTSIRELRIALAGSAPHWWETHPETSFAIMNNEVPLASKRTGQGVGQRLHCLRRAFPSIDIDAALADAPERVPVDDILDAMAAAWSAQRTAHGTDRLFGQAGRDDQGFAIGIRV